VDAKSVGFRGFRVFVARTSQPPNFSQRALPTTTKPLPRTAQGVAPKRNPKRFHTLDSFIVVLFEIDVLFFFKYITTIPRTFFIRYQRYDPQSRSIKATETDVFVVEKNLIAMGDEVRRETGNDVFKSDPQLNEWMQRVKKLGGATDVDDDERSKRLEEVNNPPQRRKV
jgi:hypothetical protein